MNNTVNTNNAFHSITQYMKNTAPEQIDAESLIALVVNAMSIGTKRKPDPTQDKTLSDAIQVFLAAKAKHLSDSEEMESILAAIENCQQQKQAAQEEGQKAEGDWRSRFRQLRGAITDDMKQQHIQRIAQRELAVELDGLLLSWHFIKTAKS
ncbi:hypothetical protein [Serratia sp. UGAL515B_01]|uniref:hypothetical protein n=1 Tax=Serratia sp. UGAL515B_01 TaxID=2986763 RepID=UPI0029553391|nr:hypothetical protein [Serratia sp. UGAL515B_01]